MKTLENLQKCIQVCWECRNECQVVLFNHCLEMGGKHVEAEHVKSMMDCIQICQVAADAMVRQSSLHADICTACARICDACADSCESLPGEEMRHCADICRKCADSCRESSAHLHSKMPPQEKIEGHIMA